MVHCVYKHSTETGKVGVVREIGRTADDRVIKAELHLPDRTRRWATIRPSRLLLMTWASKNWPLLSRPSLHCVALATLSTKYHIILVSAVFCIDVRRLTLPHMAIRRRMSPYIHKHACRMRQLTVPYAV